MSLHRAAAVAGSFYPRDAARLHEQVAGLLAAVPEPPPRRWPKLLVVPHAGYVYSGPIAARGWSRVAAARGQVCRVVLIGPAHRVAFDGIAAPSSAAFDTPLGALPVDTALIDALAAALPQLRRFDRAHAEEHCLEVQLPFVHEVLGTVAIVPLLVGRAAAADVAAVIEAAWGGDETLVVISSDLSHYHPHALAQRLDAATVQRIVAFDASLGHDEACGATPINAALRVAQAHRLQPRLLDLRNSGDTAGDRDRVVGYAAIEWCAPGAADDVADATADDAALGAALLARAHNAIAERLGLPLQPEPDHPRLSETAATFVTLRRAGGELRGCAGRLRARAPLGDDVRSSALAAAFEDPRFAPVGAAEAPALAIEVSLLGRLEPLRVASEAELLQRLRPGVDGVVLRWRGRDATLLPQVWQQLPAAADFVAALKRKAGLPAGAWDPSIEVWRYAVQHFDAAAAAGGVGDGRH